MRTTIHTGMEEQDEDAQRQLESLKVLYGACQSFWLGTQAAEEAAAAAATETEGFPATSLPLAAAMMLDRWSLLLEPERPSCITPKMMARKAMILHKGCESPSLRREIKEELLGRRMLAREQAAALEEHGEVLEFSRRPHIYDIPCPPRTSALFRSHPPQEPQAAAQAAPEMHPFSQSHVYTASRAFYARNEERAWISAVPFGVTTNAKLADAYVRVLLAYLRDLSAEGTAGCGKEEDGEGARTVHIVEVAAGHGLFGFLLAKRLRELVPALGPPAWRVRILMTDFNPGLLESRRAAPWLAPFVADGSVDFAVLDASESQPPPQQQGLELLSGRVLRPGSLQGPLVVLGNYAVDSLPADIFFQLPKSGNEHGGDDQHQGEEEDGKESVVREFVVDPTTRRFHLAAPSAARLESYPHAGLLRAMLSRGREGLHVVNVGLLTVLARLRALLHPDNQNVAVLVGDGAYQFDDDHWLEQSAASARPEGSPRPPLPDMSPAPGSGCWALAVDAQALALAVRWAFFAWDDEEKDGGGGWLAVRNTEVESSLTVSLVARRPPGSELPRTQAVFWRRLCLESPTDIEQLGGLLQQEVEEDGLSSFPHPGRRSLVGCLGLQGLLALLAWSNHDADLFFVLMWPLRAHLCRGQAAGLRSAALQAALRCLDNRLALGQKAYSYTRLMGMRFLYALGEPAVALSFFLHDAGFAPSASTPPPPQWGHEYSAGFGRAAEAFMVVRCLEALHGTERGDGCRYDYPFALRRGVLEGALADEGLRDGKGRRRIKRALRAGGGMKE